MFFFESLTLMNLSIGVFMGMIIWDLAIETRDLSGYRSLEIVQSFYEGLQSAKPAILLILLVSILKLSQSSIRNHPKTKDSQLIIN